MNSFKLAIENGTDMKKYYFAEHKGLVLFYVLDENKFTIVIADTLIGITAIEHEYDKNINDIKNKESVDILTLSGYMFPQAHLIDEEYYTSIMNVVNKNIFFDLFSLN